MSDLQHLILIDGSGFIFRAFYALPPMNRSDGTPTNAAFGFANMLLKEVEAVEAMDGEGTAIAVIFDAGRKTFRNDLYPEYKANRGDPPEELVPQFAIIKEAPAAFSIPGIDMPGFEADDLIATYARLAVERGIDVTIVSSDKDLMQLVGGQVTMFDPMKNKRIGVEEVREKFGVGPDRVVDVQALAGDSSDNVPGVPGIGVKTAAELINQYGDLDTLLERAHEIKQPKRRERLLENADMARLSRELVHLKDDVAVEMPIKEMAFRPVDADRLYAYLEEWELTKVIVRAKSLFGPGNGAAVEKKALAPAAKAASKGPAGKVAKVQVPMPVFPSEAIYELVTDIATLEDWVADGVAAGIVAMDTETTSLDVLTAELVGVSLCIAPGRACYIPLAHKQAQVQGEMDLGGGGGEDQGGADGAVGTAVPGQIGVKKALAVLGPLLTDPGVLKIGHNIKYDMAVLASYGQEVAPVDDTMLLSYVEEGGLHGHGLDELCEINFAHTNIKFSQVAGVGKKQVTFDYVSVDVALDYAAEDADMTRRLYAVLKPQLVAAQVTNVYETIERPLIPVLVAMEREGIKVDEKVLRALSKDFEKRMAAFELTAHKLAGREFALASPKQLGEVLFDEMGIPGGKRGKSGQYATGAGVLDDLAAQGHDLPQVILDWRQIAKLKSTYTDALIAQINPKTGRVHTSYSMAATSTGRLASSDPNLQNIPVRSEEGRKIRAAFVAEKGNVLLSVDYSQIELRLLAHVAGIDTLKEAFRDGQDIHALTASQVFNVPMEKMDGETRRRAKAINFGIIYGISAFGLARQLGISNGEAKEFIDAYFERYPGIRDYMEVTKEEAREHGYVTTIFGRKCFTPGIKDRNGARRQFAERAAINAPLQGAAADIIKRAMPRVQTALAQSGLGAKMLLQVHDELLFEVPEKTAEKTAALVKEIMEGACEPALTLSVPLTADIGIAKNWAEAH
ncbi:MAG: DNA polymerase I [Rhodospirillaceae bacterium]|nr:DNA polymerase I [Rhodospirillaceae bacterium]